MPEKNTQPVEILSVGLEGGGCEIMGRRGPEGWTFWQAGTSIDIDLDDNEVWRSFKTEPVPPWEWRKLDKDERQRRLTPPPKASEGQRSRKRKTRTAHSTDSTTRKPTFGWTISGG